MLAILLLCALQTPEPPAVVLVPAPEGELQPQVEVDGDGIAHLLTFSGDAEDGELRYRTSADGGDTWAAPLRAGAHAVARERVRGGRIALGREGWVHVAWPGSDAAEPRAAGGAGLLLYARLGLEQDSFEPARDVAGARGGLDAGCAIAADGSGRVWIVWHAPGEAGDDERQRVLWIARSTDDGASFEPARAAWSEPTGACASCAPALATDGDALYALYRGAGEFDEHGSWLLVSHDGGGTFEGRALDSWKSERCPQSSAALRPGPLGMLGAWERAGALSIASFRGLERIESDRKFRHVTYGGGWWAQTLQAEIQHPSLVLGAWGELLVVAVTDVHWGRERRLDWTAYDAEGARLGAAPDPLDPVPEHSLASGFARTDGSFVVIY